jgi:hypothetical protein
MAAAATAAPSTATKRVAPRQPDDWPDDSPLSPLPYHGYLRFGLCALWAVVLWVVLLYRVSGGDDEIMSYYTYFTNWSWTVQALFFGAWTLAYADTSGSAHYLLAHLYWVVNGTAWLVFWLVVVMLADNPMILIAASTMGGGSMSLGAVMTGNTVVHVVPAIADMIFYILFYHHLRMSLIWMASPRAPPAAAPFFIVISTLYPLAFGGVWLLGHNPETVYGLSAAGIWYVLWVSPLAVFLFSGLWLLFTSPLLKRRPGQAAHPNRVRDPETGAPQKTGKRQQQQV